MARRAPVCLVVAASERLGIGLDNHLPWRLPGDMAAFKRITSTAPRPDAPNAVIMGRKTWESIPPKFRPLAGRTNVVLTRQPAAALGLPADVVCAASLAEALDALNARAAAGAVSTVYIIGGGQVYREALEAGVVDRVYLTRVQADPPCDTYLPPPEDYGFRAVYASAAQVDAASGIAYRFEVLDRAADIHPALPHDADLAALVGA